MESSAFGRLLRFWRASLGLSQEALAHAANTSARHVSRLETGKVAPSDDLVLALAAAMELGRRDRTHLLMAAGHPATAEPVDPDSPSLNWLRRTAEILLHALDPYPSMVTDGVSHIHLVNRSWLGLFTEIDPAAHDAVRQYYSALLEALRADGELGLDSQCGLLLTLQQEALIHDSDRLAALVAGLAADHQIPDNWAARAARFEPIASFGVSIDVGGTPARFFHLSRSLHPHGPSTYTTGGGLVVFSLLPDDLDHDWASELATTRQHSLCPSEAP